MSILDLLASLRSGPRAEPPEPRWTVPVTTQADGDEEEARRWLDRSAQRAGEIYAAKRWPGTGGAR